MFLIMSAAYVDQELKSEFGKIPPSFLPLANQRLFLHQVALVPDDEAIYLSLPASYKLSFYDQICLEENCVKVIFIPDSLSLGASLITTLNLINEPLAQLQVLFGDTLIRSIPEGENVVAVAEAKDVYEWSVVDSNAISWLSSEGDNTIDKRKRVVCGYFNFSQPKALIDYIEQSSSDFVEGLNKYYLNENLTTVQIDDWLDFGHASTYYRSKMQFTTQRAFNELTITPKWVEKSGNNNKIQAEANWFTGIPEVLRVYTPQFLGSYKDNERFHYKLEYLHLTALNELYVFSELPVFLWKKILYSCFEFIEECQLMVVNEPLIYAKTDELFEEKTQSRLQQYCIDRNISETRKWVFNEKIKASVSDILALSRQYLPESKNQVAIMHGDFCFSNILFDFRTSGIKVIDPRGLTFDGDVTIYGDSLYDIAKLSHSIVGMYDWIMAGYHVTSINSENYQISFRVEGLKQHQDTQKVFMELAEEKFGLTPLNLLAAQIELFLSMLPLHGDDEKRQQALFANAFRLYELMLGYIK